MYAFPKPPEKPHSWVLWQMICAALLNPLKKETLAFCLPSRGRCVYHRSSVRILVGDGREGLEIYFGQCLSLFPAESARTILALDISKLLNISRIYDKVGM